MSRKNLRMLSEESAAGNALMVNTIPGISRTAGREPLLEQPIRFPQSYRSSPVDTKGMDNEQGSCVRDLSEERIKELEETLARLNNKENRFASMASKSLIYIGISGWTALGILAGINGSEAHGFGTGILGGLLCGASVWLLDYGVVRHLRSRHRQRIASVESELEKEKRMRE